MALEVSVYFANKILDHLRGVIYTPPDDWYVALFNGDPLGAGTELVGGGYERQVVEWNSASARSMNSSAGVTFSNLPGGSVTHAALFEADAGGQVCAGTPLDAAANLAAGDNYSFDAGNIILALDLAA